MRSRGDIPDSYRLSEEKKIPPLPYTDPSHPFLVVNDPDAQGTSF